MTYINMAAVSIAAPLKSSHYAFPRAQKLEAAFSWCLTDYYTKAQIGRKFEARGLVVTAEPRVGKTQEIERMISKFNEAGVLMPDGRPARIVSCLLSRKDTWKELGVKTLQAFGYPLQANRNQAYIWNKVHEQARRQGVIRIAFDECQHVFPKNGEATGDDIRDRFKTLLKQPEWPMMVILSGITELGRHVRHGDTGEQLSALLRPVQFELVEISKDMEEMNHLAYCYAEKAGLCFDALSKPEFFARLSHACARRWGLVIELVIDAIVRCKLAGNVDMSVDHFVDAYASKTGLPPGYSPFTVVDFEEAFDETKLLDLLLGSD